MEQNHYNPDEVQPPLPQESGPAVSEKGETGPMGLDIGTANIVVASEDGDRVRTAKLLNAFFTIPSSPLTMKTLKKDNVPFFEKDGSLYILGDVSEDFANMFGGDTRRPIESGILNPKEEEGISVIQALIDTLVGKARRQGEKICFSVPGDPLDRPASVVFHESVVRMHLQRLGYSPVPINEGLAVVVSELEGNNYTGIGISMGGGMCNVCFSYLSVPVVSFSIQKGGDHIDAMVGASVGERCTKIKTIKERELDLTVEPRNRIETGLHIYYEDLFTNLVQSLQQTLGSSEKMPRLTHSVPIVLSGGTVLPRGSRKCFIKALETVRMPVRTSDIVITEKPLYAAARGALTMAMTADAEL